MTKIYLLSLTLLAIILYIIIFSRHTHPRIDPAYWMDNKKLTESQKLKLQIHSAHHSDSTMIKLINDLSNGMSWKEAHSKLKPVSIFRHISHINIQILELMMRAFTLMVAFFLSFILTNIIKLYTPKEKILAVWYYIIIFLTSLPIFGLLVMSLEHHLSLKTYSLYNNK